MKWDSLHGNLFLESNIVLAGLGLLLCVRSVGTRSPLSFSSGSCHSSVLSGKLPRTSRLICVSKVQLLGLCRYGIYSFTLFVTFKSYAIFFFSKCKCEFLFPLCRKQVRHTWLDCLRTPTCVLFMQRGLPSCPRTFSWQDEFGESVHKC